MNNWIPERIATWADDTFGPPSSNLRIVTRALEETAELARCVEGDADPAKMVEESADITIVLSRLAVRLEAPQAAYQMPVQVIHTSLQGKGPLEIPREIVPNVMAARVMGELSMLYTVGVASESGPRNAHCPYVTRAIAWLQLLCESLGTDLGKAVDVKMEINVGRDWQLDDNGHGYHVRPGREGTPTPPVFDPENLSKAVLPSEPEPDPEAEAAERRRIELKGRFRRLDWVDGHPVLVAPDTVDPAVKFVGHILHRLQVAESISAKDLLALADDLGFIMEGTDDRPSALGEYCLDLSGLGQTWTRDNPVDVLVRLVGETYPGVEFDAVRVDKWRRFVDDQITLAGYELPEEHGE